MVVALKNLKYLDDRPVADDERLCKYKYNKVFLIIINRL